MILALNETSDETAVQANVFRSTSFRRKFSEKSLTKPIVNAQQQWAALLEEHKLLVSEYTKLKQLIDQVQSEF